MGNRPKVDFFAHKRCFGFNLDININSCLNYFLAGISVTASLCRVRTVPGYVYTFIIIAFLIKPFAPN